MTAIATGRTGRQVFLLKNKRGEPSLLSFFCVCVCPSTSFSSFFSPNPRRRIPFLLCVPSVSPPTREVKSKLRRQDRDVLGSLCVFSDAKCEEEIGYK